MQFCVVFKEHLNSLIPVKWLRKMQKVGKGIVQDSTIVNQEYAEHREVDCISGLAALDLPLIAIIKVVAIYPAFTPTCCQGTTKLQQKILRITS